VIFTEKVPVNLGAAGLEQCGHLIFGYFMFLHGLVELPGDEFLDRLHLRPSRTALGFETTPIGRLAFPDAFCST